MTLPVGSAKATIRIGAVSDIAGGDGSILGLSVRPGCPLVWAATLQGIEPSPVPGPRCGRA